MRDISVSGGGAAITDEGPGLERMGSTRGASLVVLRKTARIAGMWYLALAIAGILGFLLIRPQIYVAGDPATTLANLVDRAALARTGVVLELALVVTQAIAAVWFYKLFRSINEPAAWALAVFGMVNAVAVLASAGFMATALTVSGDPSLAPGGDAAATVQLMYQLSTNSWGVGAVFFGLWLIPMGHIAAGSGRMPAWLGRILIIGGVGYVLSSFVSHGFSDPAAWVVTSLTVPATIGEFWMIGYLLAVGIRPPADAT